MLIAPNGEAANAVDDVVSRARAAKEHGFQHIWFAQQFDVDSIALAGLVGAAVPGLGVGTAVVPINPRHPLTLAAAAQTAQAAAHGNFSLGLGLGHRDMEREAFGLSFDKPVRRLREYLTVLRSILNEGRAEFEGELLTANVKGWPVGVQGGSAVPLYVAAMGPLALAAAGELADGTMPSLAGPRTIGEFIVPTITKAAVAAGRPEPRVIACVNVLVSDNVDTARAEAAQKLAFYDASPVYQNVMAREGVASASELAVVGNVESVIAQIKGLYNAGATDVVVVPLRAEPLDLSALFEVAAGF
jgi:F420-dependent oxidoreductase-like protein